ncbi:hypothetical protein NIES2109_07540 [Nostoc sp. HK-01]|nr:hypothetical protein NIES2109_07540 [Nostoc sp. HK-01]
MDKIYPSVANKRRYKLVPYIMSGDSLTEHEINWRVRVVEIQSQKISQL